jgi:hypothetical protein
MRTHHRVPCRHPTSRAADVLKPSRIPAAWVAPAASVDGSGAGMSAVAPQTGVDPMNRWVVAVGGVVIVVRWG